MVSVSDILKVLDKIPEWAGLKAMQTRLDALEERCGALEAALATAQAAPSIAPGKTCKQCGQPTMRVTDSKPDAIFGDLGKERETWTCSNCSFCQTQLSK